MLGWDNRHKRLEQSIQRIFLHFTNHFRIVFQQNNQVATQIKRKHEKISMGMDTIQHSWYQYISCGMLTSVTLLTPALANTVTQSLHSLHPILAVMLSKTDRKWRDHELNPFDICGLFIKYKMRKVSHLWVTLFYNKIWSFNLKFNKYTLLGDLHYSWI